jgi:hypothetical protein
VSIRAKLLTRKRPRFIQFVGGEFKVKTYRGPISFAAFIWLLALATACTQKLTTSGILIGGTSNGSSSTSSPAPVTNSAGGPAPFGLNVDFNEQAFIDLIQPTSGFASFNDTLTGDSQGWPQGDFQYTLDNRYTFAWVAGAPNADPLQFSTDLSGVYTLTFNGQATVAAWGGPSISGQSYNSQTNTTTATVSIPAVSTGVFFGLQFSQTKRTASDSPGDGLTNVHLWRPGYGGTSASRFTTQWMHSIKDFSWGALRYMGTMGTNSYGVSGSNEAYPYLLNWTTDRPMLNYGPLYASAHPGNHGPPWEYVIQSANESMKNVWINVPVNASDDYVNQMATLFAQNLNSSLTVYLEYSNEMWHLGFPQGPWNKQAALDEVAAGGSNLNYDGATDPDILRFRRIAKRTVEIGQAFKAAFGSGASRIRPVFNNAWPGYSPDMLTYVSKNYGAPSTVLYGIAQTGYYSSSDTSSATAIINGEMANSDSNRATYLQSRIIATFYGLHSLVYEGGEGETGNPQAASPADPNIAAKFSASRDPRMQQVMTHDVLGNWYAAGGDLYMEFSHVGRYSVYGFWGLSEDINNLSTGKWFGATQILGSTTPAMTLANTLPATSGAKITIPETIPPSQSFALNLGPWLEIPITSTTGGTYSVQLQGIQTQSGPVTIWVDNQNIGSTQLGTQQVRGLDPVSSAVSFTVSAGLHSIFVYVPGTANGSSFNVHNANGDVLKITKQ